MSEPMTKRMADAAERAVIALRNLEDAVASAVQQPRTWAVSDEGPESAHGEGDADDAGNASAFREFSKIRPKDFQA